MQKVNYIIRLMKDADIYQVAEIDHEVFPNEWMFRSPISYSRDLNNPVAHYIVACEKRRPAPISNRRDTQQLSLFKRLFSSAHSTKEEKLSTDYIIGFTDFWLILKDVHITTIAVRSNYRQIGIGEGLLISTIEMATQMDANTVTLEVRISNEIAQSLYRKYGFHEVGRHLKYYSDNGESAVIMNTDGITTASFQSHFQQLKKAHAQRHREISTQGHYSTGRI